MLPDSALFAGRVNLVTGLSRASGKTAFTKAIIASLRNAGLKFAVISVGAGKSSDVAKSEPDGEAKRTFRLEAGEIFVATASALSESDCGPEILDSVPGESALGRLAIARAGRRGSASLSGPEHNDILAWIEERILNSGWTDTIVVDGALNRITQAAAFDSAQFLCALRASGGDYRSVASKARHFYSLASLPVAISGNNSKSVERGEYRLSGPLTESAIAGIPRYAKTVVVDDFSKVFLDPERFLSLRSSLKIAVARAIPFAGFSVALRNLERSVFESALGDASRSVISWDAYA